MAGRGLSSDASEPAVRDRRDRAGLPHAPGHVAPEEARRVAGEFDQDVQLDVVPQVHPLQHVHEVLGADVAAGDGGERAAAEAGERRLEVLHAGAQRGVGVGEAEAVGVVQVAGALDGRDRAPAPGRTCRSTWPGTACPAVSARLIVRRPASRKRLTRSEHARLGDHALEAAAERRLHRHLHGRARVDRLLRHRDDPVGGLGRAHAGVLPAVRVGGRHAHAEVGDAAGEPALHPLLVEHEAGQARAGRDAPRLREVAEQVVGVRHLRHLLLVHERADLDDVDAGGDQRLDPRDLLLGRDRRLLDLEAVARPHVVDDDVGHGESV